LSEFFSDPQVILRLLKKLLCNDRSAIACVGTELRRDDRVGLELCKRLLSLGFPEEKLIKCPYGLENCLSIIIGKKVKNLIIADAAIPPKRNANVFLARADRVSANFIATTHNIPLPMSINYLKMNGVADNSYILGIRASDLSFGEGVTPQAKRSLSEASNLILEAWKICSKTSNHC